MFCGKDESFGPMNREHFVPRCLWEGNRPKHTIVLPAHVACNSAFSDDNNYFCDILVMDERSSSHPVVREILQGRIQRKFEKRFGQIVQTVRGITLRPAITKGGIYLGRLPTFPVDSEKSGRVLKNVIKGIFYKVTGRPVKDTTEIHWWDASKLQNGSYEELVSRMSQWMCFADDVFACRYLTDLTYPDMMICQILFYRSRLFVGETIPEEVAGLIAASEDGVADRG